MTARNRQRVTSARMKWGAAKFAADSATVHLAKLARHVEGNVPVDREDAALMVDDLEEKRAAEAEAFNRMTTVIFDVMEGD